MLRSAIIWAVLAAAPALAREPVPEADVLARAAEAIRSLLESDYATPDARRSPELAAKLLELAADGQAAPEQIYFVLTEAAEIAAAAGDVELVWKAVTGTTERFDVPAITFRLDALAKVESNARRGLAPVRVVELYLNLTSQAIAAGDFTSAATASAAAERLSRRASLQVLRDLARRAVAEVEETRGAHAEYESSRRFLEDTPDDVTANEVVGRYLYFWRGDWESGVPYLARGFSKSIADLARRDLDARGSRDVNEMLAVARGWLGVGRTQKGAAERSCLAWATAWLRSAGPDLEALTLAQAAVIADEIAEAHPDGVVHGAVAIYTFDRSTLLEDDGQIFLLDVSGNGNHGRVLGAKAGRGVAGLGLNVEGRSGYVDCGASPTLDVFDQLSLSIWARPSLVRTRRRDQVISRWSGSEEGYTLRIGPRAAWEVTVGSGGWRHATGGEAQRNRWYHLVATISPRRVTLYVDGQEVAAVDIPHAVSPPTTGLGIGARTIQAPGAFNGTVDEFVMFDRVLGPKEVERLYDLGRRKKSLR